jgi:hypothetical protein
MTPYFSFLFPASAASSVENFSDRTDPFSVLSWDWLPFEELIGVLINVERNSFIRTTPTRIFGALGQ